MDEARGNSNIKVSYGTSLILSLMLFLFSFNAQSEYRAHQYVITNKSTNDTYTVVSSLNPRAYLAYHGGSMSIGLELVNTWLCPGYTGRKMPICLSPEQRVSATEEKTP